MYIYLHIRQDDSCAYIIVFGAITGAKFAAKDPYEAEKRSTGRFQFTCKVHGVFGRAEEHVRRLRSPSQHLRPV